MSGPTVPPGLKRIEVETTVAGQTQTAVLPAAPDQRHLFEWDGRDAYGRLSQGAQPVTVRIDHVYDAFYLAPAAGQRSFGRFAQSTTPIAPARREAPLSQTHQAMVRTFDAKGLGLGGWMIDVQHVYVPSARKLYLGTGEQRSASTLGPIAKVVAGSGSFGYDGDGGPAVQAALGEVRGVAVDRDGRMYIADTTGHIRQVDLDGTITTIAGGGTSGPGEGGPAVQAEIYPGRLTVAPDGSVLFVDSVFNTVRQVDAAGRITTVAGNHQYTQFFTGEGQPATQVSLPNILTGVAVGADGTVYAAAQEENYDNGVFQVGTDGIITTVAPTTTFASPPLPAPAAAAGVYLPGGVAVAPRRELLIALSGASSVLRLGTNGVLDVKAGGDFSDVGDGGPALLAGMEYPWDVAVGRDGTLYVIEGFTRRIRAIASNGLITSLVGRGTATADGAPARSSTAGFAQGLAVGPDGTVYFGRGTQVLGVMPSLRGLGLGEQIIPSPDGRELYVFDGAGRHVRTLDGRTFAVRYAFGFDQSGRLETITDANGNVTTIQRNGSGAPTAIVAPGGQTTLLTLTAEGYLRTVTNPAGETVQLTYGTEGLLTGLRTPREHDYTFSYGADGRVLEDADPAGGTQTFVRAGASRDYTVTRTTGLNVATQYRVTRDGLGDKHRPVVFPYGGSATEDLRQDGTRTKTFPTGSRLESTDSPDPRYGLQQPVRSVTAVMPSGLQRVHSASRSVVLSDPLDPLSLTSETETIVVNGRTTTRQYDAPTRTLVETTPAGRGLTTTRDALGRITGLQSSGLAPVTFERNPRGLLTAVVAGTGPTARTHAFAYDAGDRVIAITDPLNRTTTFGYDDADRVTTATRPDGAVVAYGYDASGNPTSVTPPGQPAHTLGYTPIDLEAAYTPPAVGSEPRETTTTYNVDRAPTAITRPDGLTVGFTYDGAGRVATRTTAADTVTFTYDNMTGQLTTAAAVNGGTVTHAYDGELRTATTWSGPVAGSVGWTYDPDFRVAATRVNGTHVASRTYDPDGLLTAAGALTVARDPQTGLVTGTALGAVTDTRTYNTFGELSGVTTLADSTPLLALAYTRDAAGRISAKRETVGSGPPQTVTYGYDAAGRLETVTHDDGTVVTYTYDANGNRLGRSVAPGGAAETGTYDAQDRLVTYGETTYTYTAAGELAAKTVGSDTTTYTYDTLGNLRQVVQADGTVLEYVIDPENRRIRKRVNGTLVQAFVWEHALRPAAELDGAGNVVARFVYGTRANVPEYIVKDPGTAQAATYRLVPDHLGSPRLVVNTSDGSVVQRMEYDQFGRVTLDTNPGFQPFGFAGGLYDRDTGLVRFGARDYDAVTGRWTAKDPIGFAGGDANLYGYAINDPVNSIDPFGLFYPGDFIGGVGDLVRGRRDMIDAATVGADAYFHCRANCEASRRGVGGYHAAVAGSALREILQNEPASERASDEAANAQGQCAGRGTPGADCHGACANLIPPWGIPERHLPPDADPWLIYHPQP